MEPLVPSFFSGHVSAPGAVSGFSHSSDASLPAGDQTIVQDSDFAPGTVLGGSYRLIKRLGSGGMGDIHLASHERLPGQFVVKVLHPELIRDQDAFTRFRQEALVMANIRHPNVVQLVDFNFTVAGLPYLVMEYLPGKDLAEILAAQPFLSGQQISDIVRQIACGLDSAHKKGIIHRDLKPENIMVVPCEGQGDLIKLIDFGISKARRFNHVTAASMVIGTPEFMSPEQAQGHHDAVDAPADQFALAVISYLLFTGRTPWGTNTPVEILHRVVNRDPLPITQDDTWRAVEAVLFRGMAKVPSERYPSALAFWRALDRAMVDDGLLSASAGELALPQPEVPEQDQTRIPVAESAAASPLADLDLALEEPGAEAQVLDDADKELPITTRVGKARRRRTGRRVLEAVLFLVIAGGTYVGVLEVPAVRTRATSGWNAVRALAAHVADLGIVHGHRLLSKISISQVAESPAAAAR